MQDSRKADYSNRIQGEKMNTEEKLKYLEDNGWIFKAGYYGEGEVFTAWHNGTFLDFHWLDSPAADSSIQYIKPTDLIKIIEEVYVYATTP